MLASQMGTGFTLPRSHLRLTQRCLAYMLTLEGMSTAIKEGRSRCSERTKSIARAMEKEPVELLRALVANHNHAASVFIDDREATSPVAQPLLTDYVVEHWWVHYLAAESDTNIVDECMDFLQSVSGSDLREVETWYEPFRWNYCTKLVDGRDRVVDIICSFGFVNTPNRLLSRRDHGNEPTMALSGWREILNTQDQYGVTPLIAAIGGRCQSIVKLLLQHGVSIFYSRRQIAIRTREDMYRGLHSWPRYIVQWETTELRNYTYGVTRTIDEAELALNCKHYGLAISSANTRDARASGNVLRILLKCPLIDPSAQDSQGRTPAHYIAASNRSVLPDTSTMEELVEKSRILFDSGRIALDIRDSEGNTPLAIAANVGYLDIVRTLLSTEKVDANSKNNLGLTPLLIASQAGKVEILRILLSR
ncbi:hypothetical protein KC329_g39 [Hortaea werneckii]|nr:hypothetical protein KC329_g39 [Hortaea werneckii]